MNDPRVTVTARGPFAVGSTLFRDVRGQLVATIVAKVTYPLGPGVVEAAREPLPIQEVDGHWDDDPSRSVHVPSDLAPFKDASEVVVVGAAFPGAGHGSSSVLARVFVGTVDKAVEVQGPRFRIPTAELGPAAMSAPSRSGVLSVQHRAWLAGPTRAALPQDFPTRHFQCAPRDQRLGRSFDPRERLELEHLHAEHRALVTVLGGVEPTAIVDGQRDPVKLRADLLVIDTDRALCTLTFRGHVVLSTPNGALDVTVIDRRLGHDLGTAALPPARAKLETSVLDVEQDPLETTSDGVSDNVGDRLPFLSRAEPSASLPPPPPSLASMPFGSPTMSAPPAPVSWTSALSEAAPRSTAPTKLPEAPPPAADVGKPRSLLDGLRARPENSPSREATPKEPTPPTREKRDAPATTATRHAVLDLLYADETLAARLREHKSLAPVLSATRRSKNPVDLAEPQRKSEDPERELVLRALSFAPPASATEVRASLAANLDTSDGFEPPLVLVAGDLTPTLDELEELRATVAVGTSVAGTDKRMLAALEVAGEALASPLTPPADTLKNLVRQLEAASTTLAVAPQFLQSNALRLLVEGRKWKRRPLFGGPHVRADLTLPSGEVFIVYLPEDTVARLPLLPSFPVVLACETRPREDHLETAPEALLCKGLGRVLARKS